MKFYCDEDQEFFIGVCSVDIPEEKIVKKISKVLGLTFDVTNSTPDELEATSSIDFDIDTVVLFSKDYNEDLFELADAGLGVYILP